MHKHMVAARCVLHVKKFFKTNAGTFMRTPDVVCLGMLPIVPVTGLASSVSSFYFMVSGTPWLLGFAATKARLVC